MQNCWLQEVLTIPGPVGFKEGRVVDNGRKQGGEGPQKKGGEELGDDRILEDRPETCGCVKKLRSEFLSLSGIPQPFFSDFSVHVAWILKYLHLSTASSPVLLKYHLTSSETLSMEMIKMPEINSFYKKKKKKSQKWNKTK